MAQFARPSQDVTIGGWTTNSGSAANLFASIDEDVANDADFVQSSLTVNDAYEVRLSTVPTPAIDRLHILNYRIQKNQALGNTRGCLVELRQGATVIASQNHPDLTIAWATLPVVFTREQAALITNYADLRVRFTATGTVSGQAGVRRRVQASWVQLRVPDAADLIDDWRNRWGFPVNVTTLDGVLAWLDANQDSTAIWQRRFGLARAAWKLAAYRPMLDQINAGTFVLPAHQTQAFAAAKIAGKIARLQTQAETLDAEDIA